MDLFRSLYGGLLSIRKSRHYEPLPNEVYELPTINSSQPSNRFRRKPLTIVTRWLTSPIFRRVLFVLILLPTTYILSGEPPAHRTSRRYLRFEGTLWGLGLNNILQEQLLLSYIAYASNRSFVFSDYLVPHSLPYTLYDWALRPTHMPLNTFMSGPTAGGDMPSISLTQDVFDKAKASGNPKRMQLSSTAEARLSDDSLEGDALLNTWVDWLSNVADEPCVVVDFSKKPVFDHMLFGSERVISMYPLLASTPILKDFKWAPLVQGAVDRNMAGIEKPADATSNLIPGLVAVHLRRGDYDGHCRYLVKLSVRYQGMNRYPGIVDRFDPYDFEPSGSNEAKLDHYLKHCLPDIPQIVHRLREMRAQNPSLSLTKVYLLSNGRRCQDLVLTGAESYVSGAIDMAIAEQAELFIGNGFSSLSGNIIMFRMAKGVDIAFNRFL
ncbi:hypothetical protein CPB85DRAFT_1366758 [Mucidula mucida]|nr:hypothetical protein CPB85DRAFT_1366758 [Mucidula mucida]